MAGVPIILCVCLCLQLVYGQYGFYPQRGERLISPAFGFAQNFFPNRNGVRNTLNNLFNFQRYPPNQYDQNRPIYNNQYDQNRPVINNGYDQNRPVINNGYDQNRPVNNNGYDQNRPFNNNGYDQNRPINNNQYDQNGQIYNNQNQQYGQDYPYQPNDVRFPNRGGEGAEIPNDHVNFEQPIPTTNPVQPEPKPELVETPNNEETVYGFPNNGGNTDGSDKSVPNDENQMNFSNEPTTAPFGNGETEDPFSNKNGIPTAPPPQLVTSLPQLTPVPPSESRNNFNFGSQGIFKEPCTTIDGATGSCISIATCMPYVKLLQQVKTNPAAVQVLRKAHCGFEGSNPKVCCPLPSIPNQPPPTPSPAPPTSAPTPAPVTSPAVASGKSLESDFVSDFPAPPECGTSNASFSKVVGGIDGKLGDFPWMALLGYQGRRGAATRWLCGGSLITSHHVLTAAHCIHNHEEDLYVVRLGELDLSREDEGATPIDVLIKYKIKHAEYNPKSFTSDIGLLILQQDVQFTDLIRPICIPTSSELRAKTFEKYNPIIAGWGDTEFRGPSSSLLQVLQLPVVSNDFCAKAYSEYKAQVIDERVLCAGYKAGGRDACQGDSGGPLMQPIYYPQNLTTYFFQIGVVSYGKRCAEAGFPGVYSRVTNFVPWLQQNVLGRA